MSKIIFKESTQGQSVLFPVSLDSKIPSNSPVRLINDIVDKLDISAILGTYKGGGTSSYPPRTLLKIVLYAYLNNIYSCRKIEDCLRDRISFMWLAGGLEPDHNTINRFRSQRLKDHIHSIFTQVIILLVELGHLSLDIVYIDGTKLESKANRYTFVWRKTVENNKLKLEAKIRAILSQIEEGIILDKEVESPLTPIDSEELKKRIAELNVENRSKEDNKAIQTLENKYLPKLEEYEKHLETLGDRNSYSKTDTDATFMRMKEDHMNNGQLKPAYNAQISTNNQFITHYSIYHNPGDTLTYISFLNEFKNRYKQLPKESIADAGYGSLENYNFMDENKIEPFVKFNYFHKEQKKSFKNDPFIAQNLYYNAAENYYICPMGQHMKHVKRATRVSENGYISDIDIYQAQNCSGCPLRSLCHKSKENRKIEICHELNRHKEIVRNLLNSEKGRMHRSKRPIEPEAVFGQMKFNKQYNRFRHFGKSKVMMDFAIFAIAFNLQKLLRKLAKIGSKCRFSLNIYFIPILCYYWRDTKSEIKIQFGTSEIIYPKIA